jgi:hypothetical protein
MLQRIGLVLVVFGMNSFGDEVKEHLLPLTDLQVQDLRLESDLGAMLKSESIKPSEVFREPTTTNDDWFTKILDKHLKVVAAFRYRERIFFRLAPIARDKPGRVYVSLSRKNTSIQLDAKKDELRELGIQLTPEVILALRSVFDSFDESPSPFELVGRKSSVLIDFGRCSDEEQRDWRDSWIVFSSMEGDTLIVRENGLVAWHRLETSEILNAGTLNQSVERYVQQRIDGKSMSSFTDPYLLGR